jgi:uncharacterized protein YdcH (DUF465 family)
MNINLRKASAIQNAIRSAIKDLEIVTHIELNEFHDPAIELKKANDELFANDARRQKLTISLYNIRGLVSAANSQSGVDTALAKINFIDKRIAQLNELCTKPMKDLSILEGQLNKIKESAERLYRDSVSTNVITEEQLVQVRKEISNLKKQRQALSDEIVELNIKTEIPLSEDVVDTLQKEDII